MCGVLGYYGNNVDRFFNLTSLDILSHRGPDSFGQMKGDDYFLGHTRLAIVDLSENGKQPMISNDGKFGIIFNGEIYNHMDLRREFLQHVNFISTSDTETLLHGLIELGAEFLNNINGIFAFSFYDFSTKDFIIARDQFGVKPLYYSVNDNEICFSSELKAILPFIINPTINENTIKNHLNFLWSPGESTMINEAKKLLPGHIIIGNSRKLNEVNVHRYYAIPFNDDLIENRSEEEYVNLLEKKLIQAVKRQMTADVPVGFFLSGGLDSSLIVAIARKLFPETKIRTYTINSPEITKEGFIDDLPYAKKVADYLNVDLTVVESNIDVLKYFDKVVYHLDEPQADSAPINIYNICVRAKEDGIKVLLGGTAGDDLFSGYRRHQALRFENIFEKFPIVLRKFVKKTAGKLNKQIPLFRRINKLFAHLDKSQLERMMGYFDWMNIDTLNGLFVRTNRYDVHERFKVLNEEIPVNTSDLNRMLYWELNTFLIDHNLNYTDKLSMASGVEVRVPFLDKELVEFSTVIPTSLKLKGKETKYILKKVAERYLPKDIIYRPKTGFGSPVREWVLNDMTSIIDTYLNREVIEKRGVFDYKKIRDLIDNNKKGVEDVSYSIWALLAIESWMIQFYDKKRIE